MKTYHRYFLLKLFTLAVGLVCVAYAQPSVAPLTSLKPVTPNYTSGRLTVKPSAAKADSENPKFPAMKAIDGVVSDTSRWVSQKFVTSVALEIDLGSKQKLSGAQIVSGFGNKGVVEAFLLEFWKEDRWVSIPPATIEGNKKVTVSVIFDDSVDVFTDKIRLVVLKSPDNVARIKEIILWRNSDN